MVTEIQKQEIIDFIETANGVSIKYSNVRMNGPVRVTIIKHIKTGGFLPKISRRTDNIHTLTKRILTDKVAPEKLRSCMEDDPRICLMDIEVYDEYEAWEVCYWIADYFRQSEKLLLDRDSNFFFKELPLSLLELIDGAVAGDGGIYQRAENSAMFKLALGIKQLGHLESFKEELDKYGYSGKIRTCLRFDRTQQKEIHTCSLTWTLRCFLKHRNRWYRGGRKVLPDDVLNTPTFWRWFYAGDGCLYVLSPHSYRVLISANDFTTAEVDRFISMLSEHRISSTRYFKRYTESTGEPQWILTINRRRDVDAFLAFIGPPIQSIEYKWIRPEIVDISCTGCGVIFKPQRGDNTYCSIRCLNKTNTTRYRIKVKAGSVR